MTINIRKIMSFVMILLLASQIQAVPINTNNLNEWNLSKKMDGIATRDASRVLLESTVGKSINKPEITARPSDYITREEMALMLVDVLGYTGIAKRLDSAVAPFKDVEKNRGAITIIKDLGLIRGDNTNRFYPNKTLTNEQALVITKRVVDKLSLPLGEIHSSYAIKSSEQIDVIKDLNSVSFGWSQVEYDKVSKEAWINTTASNQNDFNVPEGFEVPLIMANQENAASYLMVYLNDRMTDQTNQGKQVTLAAYIFNSKDERTKLIDEILKACTQITGESTEAQFDGVTIDFENFYNATLKAGFNTFLKELKEALDKEDKKLNVAVQPGQYYKGYDYKGIGNIADKVILMAHDYAPKTLSDKDMQAGFTVTPITPIDAIYKALKQITDPQNGIDPSKVMLQISFASTQWQVKDNKIINKKPFTPSYDKIYARLQNKDTQITYSGLYQNPYAVYYDAGIKNVIWYENTQSVEAKINLAKMFGVNKISLWRLGTIPNYIDDTNKKVNLDIMAQLFPSD